MCTCTFVRMVTKIVKQFSNLTDGTHQLVHVLNKLFLFYKLVLLSHGTLLYLAAFTGDIKKHNKFYTKPKTEFQILSYIHQYNFTLRAIIHTEIIIRSINMLKYTKSNDFM